MTAFAAMLTRRPGALVALAVLVCVAVFGPTSERPLADAGLAPEVDGRIAPLLAEATRVPVLVLFRGQPVRADLAPQGVGVDSASALVRGLQASAASAQSPVRSELGRREVPFRAYWIANAIAVDADRALLDWLAGRGEVARIEYDEPWHVELESDAVGPGPAAIAGVEWNVSRVGAPTLWAAGVTGQGITYAIADTGVDWQHPALKPSYRGWDGAVVSHAYHWWDAIHGDISGDGQNSCGYSVSAPCDDYGHGTHALGIGVGSDGASNQIGVAPGARWIACRNMEAGFGRPSTYIECLQFFTAPWDQTGANANPALRAHVVSNSYTCPPDELCTSESLRLAVQNVRAAGIAFVASAGNYGPSCQTVQYPPATYVEAFSVGATDEGNALAAYSSRGPAMTASGSRLKPELVAPGSNVRSAVPGTGYGYKSGTSMAGPHVAGAIALLWSGRAAIARDVPWTEALLRATAQQVTVATLCGDDQAGVWPNNVAGFGLLDVAGADGLAARGPVRRLLLNIER